MNGNCWRTDRQTTAKQHAVPSSKGGIKYPKINQQKQLLHIAIQTNRLIHVLQQQVLSLIEFQLEFSFFIITLDI